MSRLSSAASKGPHASMVSTLLLFPTETEAAGLRHRRRDAASAVIGVGMAAAAAGTAHAIATLHPRRVVLCGIAGVCGGELCAGEVVEVVDDSVAALPAAYRRSYRSPRRTALKAARAVTVNAVGEALPSLPQQTGEELPVVEQMEGASVAAVCAALGVEYMHIRAISNRVGDDRGAWRVADAVEALGAVAAELCL